jgi:signal transduction histidine kinase
MNENSRRSLRAGPPRLPWPATLALLCLVVASTAGPAWAGAKLPARNVLILHAQDQFLPANIVMDRNIYAALKGDKDLNVTIYSEYLEKVRFVSEKTQGDITGLLHAKYGSMKLDLVMVTDDLSLDFILGEGGALFSGIPVVFCGITDSKIEPRSLPPAMTGNFKHLGISENIETILKVQPRVKQIAIVLGASRQDVLYESLARKAFDSFSSRVSPLYLVGLTIEETLERIASLPKTAVVLYVSLYVDGAGRGFNPRDVAPLLRKVTSVPIYGVSDTYLSYGILGGNLLSFTDLSLDAAATATRILKGARPSDIPAKVLANKNYFDWTEMRAWGLRQRDLPPGSVIVNKSPDVWDLYKWQILGALAFLLLETLLVLYLILQLRLKKVAEGKLKSLNETLEKKVLERTGQLESANKELEAFSYTVSHDLRAPLRHIDGYVGLLVSRCRDGLDDKGIHYLDTIAAAAREMGILIDELLRFSHTGRTELRSESVDMGRAASETLSALLEGQEGRRIEWSVGELPSVRGDAALLRQVWVNLLGNAVKYTRTREVARIQVSSRELKGETVFSVEDNGVGFDMQHAGKLFGVFQRLHAIEEFEGSGIGLATVQRIVSRHGGRIWAEARPDKGASFHFALPRAGDEEHGLV